MNDCIFCKIAAGKINADPVYSDDRVMALRDINPQAPVHILIIPKKHIESLLSIQEEDSALVADIHRAIQKVAEKVDVAKSGFRIVVNTGINGGQTVGHLHYHLLGGRRFKWPAG